VEREGWLVLVMLGSAGGGGNPHGNLVAAYDDAMRRLRIRSSFLFAVGGRMAADAAGMRTDFRGMICSSADLSELFLNRTARNEKRRFAAYFPIGAGASTRDARGRESPPAVVEFAEKLAPRVSYRVGRSGGREATEEAFEWLERKVWLEAGTDRRRLDMYLWYYHSRMALCEAAETPLEKYGIISDMLAVVGKHQVRLDPEAKQRREELRRELEELESDPVLAHEIAARDLFLKVDALDDPAKYAPRRGRAAVTVQAVVASYEQVAGNYPGTVYAGKALARAKLLKEAWKLDKAR
jgi:hypothetical protein